MVVAAGSGCPAASPRPILAEHCEVLAAVPAARPERNETLDKLRGRQAALALLDRDLRINRLGDPQLPEQLDYERDPCAARDQRRVNRVVDLERQREFSVGIVVLL